MSVSLPQRQEQEVPTLGEILREQFAAMPTAGTLGHEAAEYAYSLAYGMLQQQRYALACDYFFALVSYCPLESKFLLGYGLALKYLRRLDEAICAFSLLETLHPGNPEVTLQVAECQVFNGQTEEAAETLQLVINYCEQYPGFESVGVRARAMSGMLSA